MFHCCQAIYWQNALAEFEGLQSPTRSSLISAKVVPDAFQSPRAVELRFSLMGPAWRKNRQSCSTSLHQKTSQVCVRAAPGTGPSILNLTVRDAVQILCADSLKLWAFPSRRECTNVVCPKHDKLVVADADCNASQSRKSRYQLICFRLGKTVGLSVAQGRRMHSHSHS